MKRLNLLYTSFVLIIIGFISFFVFFEKIPTLKLKQSNTFHYEDQYDKLNQALQCPAMYGTGGSLNSDVLTAEQWYTWNEHGYLKLENFLNEVKVTQLRRVYDHLWNSRNGSYSGKLTIDLIGSTGERKLFENVADHDRKVPYKLNDIYLVSKLVREAIIGGNLSHILEALLDAPAVICNSLTFEWGSQQPDHFDTWYKYCIRYN